jgi:hypothetical protein
VLDGPLQRLKWAGRMSINDEGFLSPDIVEWIGRHRADNRDWFALAADLNGIAQGQLAKLTAPDGDHQSLVVALCFIRVLSLFQGSVIMAERGMITEARTLVRSCFETVFVMGAAHNRPDIGELLMQDDAHRRKNIAEKVLANHKILNEEDERLRAVLTGFLEDQNSSELKGQALPVLHGARMAGLEEVYDVYYRSLSNDSAHPSLASLKRHLPPDGSPHFPWGPDVSDVGQAISYACTACIYMIKFGEDRFGPSGLDDRIDRCWAAYKRLIDAQSG